MFESIAKGIIESIKSTKTFMASVVMAFLIQKYINAENTSDENSPKFWLFFFVIFCGSFLIISFCLWLFNIFMESAKASNRIAQKNQATLDSLKMLTNEEMQLITELVDRGHISGTLEISEEQVYILDHLNDLRLIDTRFVDMVGPYRAVANHRYRYQINEAVFDCLNNKEK